MNDTALCYSLSTIAQTLAAGFAVLAAFVLYRLQGIEAIIFEIKHKFSEFKDYITEAEIWNVLFKDGFQSLDAKLRQIQNDRKIIFYGGTPNRFEEACYQLIHWWPIHERTLLWLRYALIATVLDISLCFLSLPLVPYLSLHSTISIILLFVAVIGGVIAVLIYAKLIISLLYINKIRPDAS